MPSAACGNAGVMSPFSSSPPTLEALLAEPARMLGEVLSESLPATAVRPVYQPIVDLDGESVVG